MKKIILLLILPFVTLMAIDFTMTRDGLITPSSIDNSSTDTTAISSDNATSDDTATSSDSATSDDTATSSDSATSNDTATSSDSATSNDTATSSDSATSNDTATSSDSATSNDTSSTNPYLEPVNLPKCDASNPEVQFIRSNADWKTINSSSKRIFCVSPGDYRSLGNIKITANGTAEKRRYIILNNGNDTHPGKLDKSQLANFALDFQSAGYWVVDRFSAFDTKVKNAITLDGAGTIHNIINRAFTDNYSRAIRIEDQAHNTTVQNGRFQNMKPSAMDSDVVAINLGKWGVDYFEIKNTKIINNEIVTSNDGIQITRNVKLSDPDRKYQDANCEGTIIDGNHIWQDLATMGGAKGENAIDIKIGSDNPSNPVIISNNHMWNWNKETTDGGGGAMVLHYSPKNVKVNNNVFFDSGLSVTTGGNGPVSGFPYGMLDGEVANNLIYNMALSAIKAGAMFRTDIHDNTFIKCNRLVGELVYNKNNSYFRNNTLINTSGEYKIEGNDSTFTNSLATNIEYDSTQNASYTEDYVFTTDKFTNNPRMITLENAVKPE